MSELLPPPWDPQLPGQGPQPEQPQAQPGPQPQGPQDQQQPVNPPGTFAPPPGTQYGSVQYGSQQYGSQQYGSQQYGWAQQGSAQYPQPPTGYPAASYPPSYDQYGQGPYGYGPGAYGPASGTNGMAIAALVLGICGFFCVTPLIGLGLGIAAWSQTSKTGQSGKGMAIAGVVLSVAWIALAALLVATGHFHMTDGGTSTSPTQGTDGTPA